MSEQPLYIVRDGAGAIYGPAAMPTLRQWIDEGRITPHMEIAAHGTQDFRPAGQVPELLAAFTPSGAVTTTTASPTASSPASNQALATGQPYPYASVYPKSSGLAIAALVCGILSFMCGFSAIVAVVLGHIARGQIRREPERYEGYGMATAGLIIGYIALAISALVLLLYLVVIAIAVSQGVH